MGWNLSFHEDDLYTCPHCDVEFSIIMEEDVNYCPHCGESIISEEEDA